MAADSGNGSEESIGGGIGLRVGEQAVADYDKNARLSRGESGGEESPRLA